MSTEQSDHAGRTALHYAVITAPVGLNYAAALDDPELAEQNHRMTVEFILANTTELLSAGADVNARDREGYTPLHFAAKGPCDEAVRLLLESGAEIDIQNTKGETPLYIAVRNTTGAALNIVRQLRGHSADPTIETASGSSALGFVRRFGTPELKELFADLL